MTTSRDGKASVRGERSGDLFQDALHPLVADRPRHLRRDVAFGVDHYRAGPDRIVEGRPYLGCMPHRVRHPELLDVAHAVFDRVVVRDSGKDRLILELLRQLVEVGLFAPADRSPRFPEVEYDRRSALLREAEGLAFKGLE